MYLVGGQLSCFAKYKNVMMYQVMSGNFHLLVCAKANQQQNGDN